MMIGEVRFRLGSCFRLVAGLVAVTMLVSCDITSGGGWVSSGGGGSSSVAEESEEIAFELFSGNASLDRDGNIIEVDVDSTLPFGGVSSLGSPGDYILEFLDHDANLMRSIPFGVAEGYHKGAFIGFKGEGSEISSSEDWWVPVEDPPDYASYRVSRNGVEIIEVVRSANAPVVTITEPVAGQVFDGETATFSWNGSDADGDDLIYAVHYSTDNGETYHSGLGSSLNHESIVRNIEEYLEGSETARLKVIALDGTRWAIAESPVFTVVNPPDPLGVTILSPHDRTEGYNPWCLEARSTSSLEPIGPYPRTVDNSDIEWFSDIDGDLGPNQLEVWLSPGTHQLTANVTDNTGLTGSATVTITVLERPEPEDKDSDR